MFVTIKKLSEKTGYSEEAIRAKIKKGAWRIKVHFEKAPDGRILLKEDAINDWIEGK